MAWMAGFVDGEGCLGVYRQRRPKSRRGSEYLYSPHVAVANTNREILELFKLHFGGGIRPLQRRGAQKPCYYWRVSSDAAIRFALAVHSYLKLKKFQSELILEFGKTRGKVGCNGHPKEILQKRQGLYEQTLQANHRGKELVH